jgi:hypothetical protein
VPSHPVKNWLRCPWQAGLRFGRNCRNPASSCAPVMLPPPWSRWICRSASEKFSWPRTCPNAINAASGPEYVDAPPNSPNGPGFDGARRRAAARRRPRPGRSASAASRARKSRVSRQPARSRRTQSHTRRGARRPAALLEWIVTDRYADSISELMDTAQAAVQGVLTFSSEHATRNRRGRLTGDHPATPILLAADHGRYMKRIPKTATHNVQI